MFKKTHSSKISVLPLFNFVWMLLFCVDFFGCDYLISFKCDCFFLKKEIQMRPWETISFDCNSTRTGPMLKIGLKTGPKSFSNVEPRWVNCGILRLFTILEKNLFKTMAVSLSVFMILSPLTMIIFKFEVILVKLKMLLSETQCS